MKKILTILVVSFLLSVPVSQVNAIDVDTEDTFNYRHIVPKEEREADLKRQMEEINKELESGNIDLYSQYEYRYETQYGGWRYVTIPKTDLAGQLPGGVKLPKGGLIHINKSGGSVGSVGVSFPKPYNFINISASMGSKVSRVTGFSVPVPSSNFHYRAWGKKVLEVKPYITWKINIRTGKKTIHERSVIKTMFSEEYNVRQAP